MPKSAKGKPVMACSCGHTSSSGGVVELRERGAEKGPIVPIIDEQALPALPLTEKECPKCGHAKAFWWTKQTRAADEPETSFFKCEKCSHTWREYR